LLESTIDHPTFSGPVLGILEPKNAEWHPLEGIVSVPRLLYVWKQNGETVTVELTAKDGQVAVSELR
jgi:hypothetical protein